MTTHPKYLIPLAIVFMACSKPQTEMFIDMTPSSPAVLATAYRRVISIEDAERKHCRSETPGSKSLAFGNRNEDWEKFKANLLLGDDLVEFYNPPPFVGAHHGYTGFDIVRQGKVIATFISQT